MGVMSFFYLCNHKRTSSVHIGTLKNKSVNHVFTCKKLKIMITDCHVGYAIFPTIISLLFP